MPSSWSEGYTTILPPDVRASTAASASVTPSIPVTASTEMFVSSSPASSFRSTAFMSGIPDPLVPKR